MTDTGDPARPAAAGDEGTGGRDSVDRLEEAARNSSLARAAEGSVYEAIGGGWGIVSAVLPGALFVVIYSVLHELAPALIAAIGAGVLLMAVSLIRRRPFSQAIGGLLGVAACAFIAYRSGEASDYFVLGFWTNAGSILLLLTSLALRHPLIGVLAGMISPDFAGWREDPSLRRIMTILTWAWAGVFALRIAVQLPFYFADDVAVLGTLRLAMGLPLFALMLWVTWLALRRRNARS
ncbi:DUF3159 domain-containing protein [Sediminivirga luteola]|uniref:DUF3159 domain-containing protein n=1 Tax=Sediminivirga luteola TaxID=1774748 RepID=A0A8J2TWK0_9MICO|nr:DUF3159 domain-containing protein [Sediminivirga luteola]MCI2266197.1 DUF3159 domain-containing protein [Sediminivirga luteola]GGA08235.1 hypothetical protein GCM10011333_08870 [Sediminivirga luteola]